MRDSRKVDTKKSTKHFNRSPKPILLPLSCCCRTRMRKCARLPQNLLGTGPIFRGTKSLNDCSRIHLPECVSLRWRHWAKPGEKKNAARCLGCFFYLCGGRHTAHPS